MFCAELSSSAIKRVLVANRGEIASRVIKSLNLLNIDSVAVFADSDAGSPYVDQATRSIYIGAAAGGISPYLDGQRIIQIALELQVDAIHPGYGYLSENAQFAQAVVDAGLIFIGPTAHTISTIGDKAAAKTFLAANTTIPLVPGYSGSDQSLATLIDESRKVGYPLLIKASAGGGGKGMRIVYEESALAGELERAASESLRNFGDKRLILERYVEGAKHIEIQLMGDSHGSIVSLFERECSVQRRNQKIIEESPAPNLSSEVRERMSAAAREIGQALRYENAGTVEFILDVDTNEFFFLEVNTRVQVEHPITEMVTGIDIIALQVFVAGGGNLSSLPEVVDVQQRGHAIEARLCSEDSFADFAPRIGTIRLWIEGSRDVEGTRVDSGVATGSDVTVDFDPMLAKLIVWAPTRAQAIEKLKKMLQSSVALGITTNQPFLLNCLSSPSFVDGSYTTALIPRHIDSLLAPTLAAFAPERQLETKLALVASVFLRHVKEDQETRNLASIPSDWSALNRQDLSRLPLEDFEIFLPNGTTTSLKLELPIPPATALVPFSTRGTTYNFRTWKNPPAIPADKSKGSGAAKAALVDNFYRGIASRDGAEGREVGDWKLGVGEDSIESVDVNVSAVRSFTEQRGGRTWIHGYVRAGFRAPNGISVEETFFVATDDIGGSIGEAQTVFVHSREIASSIQVKRRDLLTFAGQLDSRVAGNEGEGDQYRSSMPSRILEIVAEDGSTVSKGDPILIMESMKTEIRIVAKTGGTVKMLVVEGEVCSEGKVLCEVVGGDE